MQKPPLQRANSYNIQIVKCLCKNTHKVNPLLFLSLTLRENAVLFIAVPCSDQVQ